MRLLGVERYQVGRTFFGRDAQSPPRSGGFSLALTLTVSINPAVPRASKGRGPRAPERHEPEPEPGDPIPITIPIPLPPTICHL